MGAQCSSGVWVKYCSWLKDYEMGMDVCNWLLCMHKNASHKLLWFMHHSLSSERLFIICNFLLRSAPHAFLNHIPWSKERCPRKDGHLEKWWTAPGFPGTLFLHGEILQSFRIVFFHQNTIHTLLSISEAEYQDVCCRQWVCEEHRVLSLKAGCNTIWLVIQCIQELFARHNMLVSGRLVSSGIQRSEAVILKEQRAIEIYLRLVHLRSVCFHSFSGSQCTRLKCHITARVSGDYVCSNEKSVLQTRLFRVGFCFLAFLNLILYPWTKLKFVLHEFQKQGISGSQGVLWRARKLQFHPGSGTDLLLCDFREDIQHEIQVSAFTWVSDPHPSTDWTSTGTGCRAQFISP